MLNPFVDGTILLMPPWSNTLCNLYWIKRSLRAYDRSGRRAIYRRIAQEKCRLIQEVGIDPEELRLLCRHLANTQNKNAEARRLAYASFHTTYK